MIFGDHRVEIIPDTEFRLDGGAMFGVVPRVLWERVSPPDEKNRIRMNMNCVFIDTGKEKILIETGIGEKFSAKEAGIYGVFRERPFAASLFEKTGYRPEDITIVVNTHLHFDHCGGNTIREDREKRRQGDSEHSTFSDTPHSEASHSIVPQFPNARYLVSKSEFEHAENPHERDRASYIAENWKSVETAGQLELIPDVYEVVPGLTLEINPGHNEAMQTWRLDSGGRTLYGFADLVPTRHHVSFPWIMGYDLYPMQTLAFKKRMLPQAVRENWTCIFYHDFEQPIGRIVESDGKIKFAELDQ